MGGFQEKTKNNFLSSFKRNSWRHHKNHSKTILERIYKTILAELLPRRNSCSNAPSAIILENNHEKKSCRDFPKIILNKTQHYWRHFQCEVPVYRGCLSLETMSITTKLWSYHNSTNESSHSATTALLPKSVTKFIPVMEYFKTFSKSFYLSSHNLIAEELHKFIVKLFCKIFKNIFLFFHSNPFLN